MMCRKLVISVVLAVMISTSAMAAEEEKKVAEALFTSGQNGDCIKNALGESEARRVTENMVAVSQANTPKMGVACKAKNYDQATEWMLKIATAPDNLKYAVVASKCTGTQPEPVEEVKAKIVANIKEYCSNFTLEQ